MKGEGFTVYSICKQVVDTGEQTFYFLDNHYKIK